ncbi:hypothetical protein MXB_4890, partial [Myxobolus squamalis]
MAEIEKISDFFSKLDLNKKKSGYLTFNDVTQKKQLKLDAQLKKQSNKREREDHTSESEAEENKTTEKVALPDISSHIDQASAWTCKIEAVVTPKPEIPLPEAKPARFVPGARRPVVNKLVTIFQEDFPELVQSGPK